MTWKQSGYFGLKPLHKKVACSVFNNQMFLLCKK
nr:MAG TPA: hypothetical protein [Caudoviricetes sp.]